MTRWCEAQPGLVAYGGQCLVRRAEILHLQGNWAEAAEAVRPRSSECLEGPDRAAIGAAWYQRAELHRLRGESEAAEEAYREAARSGRSPQPGLALLRLSQGQSRRRRPRSAGPWTRQPSQGCALACSPRTSRSFSPRETIGTLARPRKSWRLSPATSALSPASGRRSGPRSRPPGRRRPAGGTRRAARAADRMARVEAPYEAARVPRPPRRVPPRGRRRRGGPHRKGARRRGSPRTRRGAGPRSPVEAGRAPAEGPLEPARIGGAPPDRHRPDEPAIAAALSSASAPSSAT